MSWANLVGRDGIEPPTLRFSVLGPGVQQGAGPVTVLVRWCVAKQAYAWFGRVFVDRDVDRGRRLAGQDLGASEEESGGSPRRARPRYSLASSWTCLMTASRSSGSGRRSCKLVNAQRMTSLAERVEPSSLACAASRVSHCRCSSVR